MYIEHLSRGKCSRNVLLSVSDTAHDSTAGHHAVLDSTRISTESYRYSPGTPLPLRAQELPRHLLRRVCRSFHPLFLPLCDVATSGQMQCAAPVVEPVSLHFTNPDCFNLWLALLRSYAQPEVYGRWLSPASDGGLYRMWRQVELTCLQGRNLGTTRPLSPTSDDTPSPGSEDAGGGDLADIDVYCEVFVNGCLCGRTTVKRGIGAPDWQERFVLADLPPFENMELVVWREKRLAKPAVVGSVTIVLANFRRSEVVEGWFPVLGGTGGGTQAGELRLKVLVDEWVVSACVHVCAPVC